MSHSVPLDCPRNDGLRTSTAKATTATTTTGTSSFFSAGTFWICVGVFGSVVGWSVHWRRVTVTLLSHVCSAVTGYITSGKRFGAPMEKLIVGAARISRDRFLKRFDLGVPLDRTTPGNEEALIMYHHQQSLPNLSKVDAARDGPMPLLSVEDATANCDTLKIILTEPNKPRQCLAIVGQWESYHIHKYMRLPPDNIRTGVDRTLPLRNVARTHSANKGKSQIIPKPFNVETYDQKVLVPYLSNLKATLAKLKPIAAKVARDKTIVVLVCNLGQSELLMNFICSSKARGFDLSNVLVFATDVETQKIAEALGVTTFYDSVVRWAADMI
jgi:hypothetical protein